MIRFDLHPVPRQILVAYARDGDKSKGKDKWTDGFWNCFQGCGCMLP